MEDEFLKVIQESSDDNTPKLIFADWLDERGDPRGELIRLHIELNKDNPNGHPHWDAYLVAIKSVYGASELDGLIDRLSDQQQRLFACDCVESVLHHYESAFPGDRRPRDAIETSRRFAMGVATREELDAARTHVVAAVPDAFRNASPDAARAAAWVTFAAAPAAAPPLVVAKQAVAEQDGATDKAKLMVSCVDYLIFG